MKHETPLQLAIRIATSRMRRRKLRRDVAAKELARARTEFERADSDLREAESDLRTFEAQCDL